MANDIEFTKVKVLQYIAEHEPVPPLEIKSNEVISVVSLYHALKETYSMERRSKDATQ